MKPAVTLRVTELLAQRLGSEHVVARELAPDLLWLTVAPACVRETARLLKQEAGCRFLVTVGTDQRPLHAGYGIVHLFSLDLECRRDAVEVCALSLVLHLIEHDFNEAVVNFGSQQFGEMLL